MHPEICKFPNQFFYKNRLITANEIIDKSFPIQPYTVINLESFQANNRNNVVENRDEANFIALMILEIKKFIGDKYSIGIITPYQKQKEIILESLKYDNPNLSLTFCNCIFTNIYFLHFIFLSDYTKLVELQLIQ